MCENFSMEIKIWYLLKIFNIHQISVCPKLFLTKSLNFEIYSDFRQYFQKIWSQEKFRQFAKNPCSQTSWHIHTNGEVFLAECSATILSWIQQIFYSCQIVWIHPRNPKSFHTILQLVSELGYISSQGCVMEATWYATKMFCILNKYQMCWPQFSYETIKIQGKIMLDIT